MLSMHRINISEVYLKPLGFPDLISGQKHSWNWYLTLWWISVKSARPSRQIHSPHLHVGAPGIVSDLLRSVQLLKRECGAESNGKLPHLFIPSKTAALVPVAARDDVSGVLHLLVDNKNRIQVQELHRYRRRKPTDVIIRRHYLVPEFAVEDLPLDRTAILVPAFAVPLGRTLQTFTVEIPT